MSEDVKPVSQVVYTDDGDWALGAPVKGEFELLPEDMYNATCVEVVPPVLRPGYKGKGFVPSTRLVFCVGLTKKNGDQFTVSTKWMPVKTSEKSTFGKLLRDWLGDAFPSDEALANGSFKMSQQLVGRPARLTIEHEKDTDGTIWVRILRVKPQNSGDVVEPDGTYIPTTEREDAEEPEDVNAKLKEGVENDPDNDGEAFE